MIDYIETTPAGGREPPQHKTFARSNRTYIYLFIYFLILEQFIGRYNIVGHTCDIYVFDY